MVAAETLPFTLDERPRLRPVEAIPVEHGGERYVWLRDPADSELPPIALSASSVAILQLLDGARTVEGIHLLLASRLRAQACPSVGEVRAFLEQLDCAGYLEGPRARHRRQQREATFHERPVRVAVHAGGAYPDGASDLPRFLADGYLHPEGPGTLPGVRDQRTPAPRGLAAPHVDLHRGAPTYSWGYKRLAEAQPADLYVVLGTCHTAVPGSFAATRKPYDTPLGEVPTDLDFLERLQTRWQRDLFAGEFSHATEHSIEFQAVYLRSLGLAGEGQAPMVAILCDSLHALVPRGRTPRDSGPVMDFISALRETLAADGRRATLVAAVDLAHVGPRFGDPWATDPGRMAAVRQADLATLALAAAGDAEGYYAQVMRDGDARRICGFTPIYLLAALLGTGAGGDLLRYTQWVAPDLTSSVTFASLLFPG